MYNHNWSKHFDLQSCVSTSKEKPNEVTRTDDCLDTSHSTTLILG